MDTTCKKTTLKNPQDRCMSTHALKHPTPTPRKYSQRGQMQPKCYCLLKALVIVLSYRRPFVKWALSPLFGFKNPEGAKYIPRCELSTLLIGSPSNMLYLFVLSKLHNPLFSHFITQGLQEINKKACRSAIIANWNLI